MRGQTLNEFEWQMIRDILIESKARAEENAFQEYKRGNKRGATRLEAFIESTEEILAKIK